MPFLIKTLAAIGEAGFQQTLKAELEALSDGELPLQAGLMHSSHVGSAPPQVTVLAFDAQARPIAARVGVFYTGVIAGCNCADDPTPVDEQNEYCELEVLIDADTGAATIRLRADA
ncbi:MAG: hypothetical protein H6981_08215 [Gammaproteobacteria bacterium]|nr:hypothetical protein [Gammaproteobacteria bacterium]MCP5136770.1 hypothetical protein [Gammaproteobacteria bacterium]